MRTGLVQLRSFLGAYLRSDRRVAASGWLFLVVVAAIMLILNSSFWIYVAGLTVIYAISALGLDWIQGRAGQVSIGSAAFMAIGAFVGAVAYSKGVPSIPALALAGVAGAVVGLVVGIPALRLRGLYLALATLALQFITTALGSYYESASGQIAGVATGLVTLGPWTLEAITRSFFVALVVLLLLITFALHRIYRRAPGRAWLVIKESEISAGVIGINPTRWKLSAFVASSALIAISGGLLGFYTMRVQSESFSLDFAITFVAMVIVGGLGSIGGIIAGATIITVIPYILSTVTSKLPPNLPISQWLSTNIPYINSGFYGILLLIFLLYQPRGVAGVGIALRQRLLKLVDGGTAVKAAPAGAAAGAIGPIGAEAEPAGPGLVTTAGAEQEAEGGGEPALLEVRDLHVYRSGASAVDGVNLTVHPGEVVAILGRNGAGKTSTLRGISGFLLTERARVTGSIRFAGRDIRGLPPMATARLGLILVPEREKIFPNLSVAEHFRVIATQKSDVDEVFAIFPQLERRAQSKAGLLSGGERQMLALAVAFCMHPKLLLVDELSLGLAPAAIARLTAALKEYQKRTGVAILLVEQNVSAAMELADRIYILEAGRVERVGRPSELSEETLTASALGGG
jgi:ABC-type branched-subunit amino acid transport system ATPase component/ABC-type branched-subunit amino acid transport system permease subunit